MRIAILVAASLFAAGTSHAGEEPGGHLLIIGGGLRPDNAAIYERLVEYAGGKSHARFSVFRTASSSDVAAQRVLQTLVHYGILPERIHIVDLQVGNADHQVLNPAVVKRILDCTGLFFTGGDQQRITSSLLRRDGSDTPVLSAMRKVLARGGVLAGTSAGAAMQSEVMIAVGGLPDESLDEGMDALDFGVTKDPARRGVLVTRGLGFFHAGLVDQHFSQYRGRLGRLARAAIEQKCRYGFGIDENTAMDVGPDGSIGVLGPGTLTVMHAAEGTCKDGPLGCRIAGVRVSLLEHGDRFKPRTATMTVHPDKHPLVAGSEEINGNHLIPDIAGEGAVKYALISGLAENTRKKQVGVALQHHDAFGHGYRFTFTESPDTRAYFGYVNGNYSHAVTEVRVDIEPVVLTLQPPEARLPVDVPRGFASAAVQATWFRGMLSADDRRCFRPQAAITRAELTSAIARTIHLEPPRKDPPVATDVPKDSPFEEDFIKVVGKRLMDIDRQGTFRPSDTLTREEAATIVVRLAEAYRSKRLTAEALPLKDAADVTPEARPAVFAAIREKLMLTDAEGFRPRTPFTREQAAFALYQIIGFPWAAAESSKR